MSRLLLLSAAFFFLHLPLRAQDATGLVGRIREKLQQVNDYRAEASLKTNIPFLKVPDADVTVYYKKPDKIKIKNEQGISLVPRETVSISLYRLLSGKYQVIDAGSDQVDHIPVSVVRLLPQNEDADLVLATLYIDARRLLVLKAKITTRQNGTDEVDLTYGRYAALSLPDRIVFSFNTQDYKLPKGVTFDYDDGSPKNKPAGDQQDRRGKIEISYHSYVINKGLKDDIFQ